MDTKDYRDQIWEQLKLDSSAYLLFLDGEKHSIWNSLADVLRQVRMLEEQYDPACISIEVLPNMNCMEVGYFF